MQDTPRHHKSAIYHGFRHCCPNCGQGRLFSRYLKVAPACTICGQSFTAQKADDGPAYFTILIVGHILVPLMIFYDRLVMPPLWHQMLFAIFGTLADFDALIARARALDLPVEGLMCIPPLDDDPSPYFSRLASIAAITATGVVTREGRGEATILARYLDRMSTTQISALKATQVAALTPDQIAGFTPTQIRGLTGNQQCWQGTEAKAHHPQGTIDE